MVAVAVHAANLADTMTGETVCAHLRERYPDLDLLWADAGYRGTFVDWAQDQGITVEIVGTTAAEDRPRDQGIPILPRRWIVERTFAWLMRFRRMARDYEQLVETTRANIHLCMIHLMVARLAT